MLGSQPIDFHEVICDKCKESFAKVHDDDECPFCKLEAKEETKDD